MILGLLRSRMLLAPDPATGQDSQSGSAGGANGGQTGQSATPAPGASTGQGNAASGTFSQKDVDNVVAKVRRELQQKHLEETDSLLKSKSLTEQERERLTKRKDELEEALMTEKDRARMEREKMEKEYTEKQKTLEDERDSWQTRFARSMMVRAIKDSAEAANAHDSSQFVDLLENKADVREVLDDKAQPTGEFEVVIDHEVKDEKTGKVVKVTIPIDKYIQEVMVQTPRYRNLFGAARLGGTGYRPGQAGGAGAAGAALSPVQKIGQGLRVIQP